MISNEPFLLNKTFKVTSFTFLFKFGYLKKMILCTHKKNRIKLGWACAIIILSIPLVEIENLSYLR